MEIRAHFENHKSVIADEMEKAEKEVLIAVAWINFKEYFEIFDALLQNNVALKIICSDNIQNRAHIAVIKALRKRGAQIKLLEMPTTRNHMHHKFAVIDGQTLINGSFNWSPNAERSLENLIVVKDCKKEVSKFIEEFERILSIEKDTIKALHKRVRCIARCGGEMLNVLVFSEQSNYFETFGDIISVCTQCCEFTVLENAHSNTRLYVIAESLASTSDDYEYEYLQKEISELLNSYINGDITLHGIGKVFSGLEYDEDFTSTRIIWRNKFVGDRLPPTFDDMTFDVLYDN